MFRYVLSPIDRFLGCISLAQYLDQIRYEQEHYGQMMTKEQCEKEISAVVERLACEMGKLYRSGWEGDVRDGTGIYVFAVPGEESDTEVGFVFKQDNNGTTFVISPVELPHLRDHLAA